MLFKSRHFALLGRLRSASSGFCFSGDGIACILVEIEDVDVRRLVCQLCWHVDYKQSRSILRTCKAPTLGILTRFTELNYLGHTRVVLDGPSIELLLTRY